MRVLAKVLNALERGKGDDMGRRKGVRRTQAKQCAQVTNTLSAISYFPSVDKLSCSHLE